MPQKAEQVATPVTGDMNAILFVNDTLGFIAGGEKYTSTEILTTSDGGKNWSLFSSTDNDSKAIYSLAYDGNTVYAVGFDGKIYIRDQAGISWQKIQTPAWEWFQQIRFTAPGQGFITGGEGYRAGRIYRTDGAGNISLVDSFEFELVDIRFAGPQKGYACGYGAVLQTEDGGASWHLLNVKGDFFRSISCIGSEHVWIAGYNGSIIHSDDGGKNWQRQRDGNNPLLKKYRLRSILFKDQRAGYAAGDDGILLKTTDGGEHWSEFEHLTDKDFKCMTLHPDGTLWVAGAAGTLFHITE